MNWLPVENLLLCKASVGEISMAARESATDIATESKSIILDRIIVLFVLIQSKYAGFG